ncbi:MAG: ATP-dependent Clp protease adaptor ClpS [Flavobacteriales bacterium]|nr:ATP-dependent Clp protease adaptor ClpS [Flavobacteriales bacterium]
MSTDTQEEIDYKELEELIDLQNIVLYNDDVNTFDFVINQLIKYCKHEPIQAEQCAYLVHHKGKCQVKTGVYDELMPVCSALLENGLTAEIE